MTHGLPGLIGVFARRVGAVIIENAGANADVVIADGKTIESRRTTVLIQLVAVAGGALRFTAGSTVVDAPKIGLAGAFWKGRIRRTALATGAGLRILGRAAGGAETEFLDRYLTFAGIGIGAVASLATSVVIASPAGLGADQRGLPGDAVQSRLAVVHIGAALAQPKLGVGFGVTTGKKEGKLASSGGQVHLTVLVVTAALVGDGIAVALGVALILGTGKALALPVDTGLVDITGIITASAVLRIGLQIANIAARAHALVIVAGLRGAASPAVQVAFIAAAVDHRDGAALRVAIAALLQEFVVRLGYARVVREDYVSIGAGIGWRGLAGDDLVGVIVEVTGGEEEGGDEDQCEDGGIWLSTWHVDLWLMCRPLSLASLDSSPQEGSFVRAHPTPRGRSTILPSRGEVPRSGGGVDTKTTDPHCKTLEKGVQNRVVMRNIPPG